MSLHYYLIPKAVKEVLGCWSLESFSLFDVVAGTRISMFTQADLASRNIQYVHTSEEEIHSDDFTFTVSDGGNEVHPLTHTHIHTSSGVQMSVTMFACTSSLSQKLQTATRFLNCHKNINAYILFYHLYTHTHTFSGVQMSVTIYIYLWNT